MSEFKSLDLQAPATLENVLEGLVRLSAYGEADILELAAAGDLAKVFPIAPAGEFENVPDFASEDELDEASPLPFAPEERLQSILSSIPRAPQEAAAASSTASGASRATRTLMAAFIVDPTKASHNK